MPDKMRDKLASWRLQPLLLGIGFLLIVMISIATIIVINRAADDADDLTQALSVQDRLSNVLLAMRRAESGQRGYLLTDRQSYLDDYEVAAPRVMPVIKELRDLTASEPGMKPAVDNMEDLARIKLEELARTVEMQKAGDRAGALRVVQSDEGRNVMESLRVVVVKAITDQVQVRADGSAATRRNNILLLMLTIIGSILIVMIGAASIFLVQRSAKRAESARLTVEATNANLEQIVAYRTADLTEANEEIQRFAYIVSHDLRSPLVNIMGFTGELEALRQDIFDQIGKLQTDLAALNANMELGGGENVDRLGRDFDEAIRFIKTSIANMDRLINAVLKLSREGRRQFNPETIDMNGLLDTVTQTVAHRASEIGATVAIETLPPVESDRLAVQQIFANLVDNALKYSRNEQPNHISVTGQTHAGKAIYEVTDTGRGIAPHDHQRVFELFRRSGTQDKPGEGIGLAHVRALVRRLGGTMSLKS